MVNLRAEHVAELGSSISIGIPTGLRVMSCRFVFSRVMTVNDTLKSMGPPELSTPFGYEMSVAR